MERPEVIYRHSGMVRITHWINALVLLVLLMSGLQIFNAHPALYLGQALSSTTRSLLWRPCGPRTALRASPPCSAGISTRPGC